MQVASAGVGGLLLKPCIYTIASHASLKGHPRQAKFSKEGYKHLESAQ